MPVIRLKTSIKAPRELCFDLSRSIDLHQQTAAKTKEKAVGGITSGLIALGETVTWEATHFGVRQQLTSMITGFEKPFFFRDEMTAGAFKRICHDHLFFERGETTLMEDIFEFNAPLGPFGFIADHLFLKRYLQNFLLTRNAVIKTMAESHLWKSFLH